MTQTDNLPQALLILGAIYMRVAFSMDIFVTWMIILLGLATWQYHGFRDERRMQINLQNELTRAKIEWYKRRRA